MNGNKVTPIVGPLLALLKSRKVIVALATLAVDLVIACVPALEGSQAELLTVFTALGALLVTAIAYEDGQLKKNGGSGG